MSLEQIKLSEKQADLAFRIMALCEEVFPDDFDQNVPVLELLYKSSKEIAEGLV